MIIEGNSMERDLVKERALQGSPVTQILFANYSSGLFKWVEEYISA